MTKPYHVILWIDHKEATVFDVGGENRIGRVENAVGDTHLHHRAGAMGSGHAHEDEHYLKAVTEALATAHEIVVTGPAQAKFELMRWMKGNAPQTAAKVLGIETLDHPTDGELLAFAKRYFHAKDRMTSQLPR